MRVKAKKNDVNDGNGVTRNRSREVDGKLQENGWVRGDLGRRDVKVKFLTKIHKLENMAHFCWKTIE